MRACLGLILVALAPVGCEDSTPTPSDAALPDASVGVAPATASPRSQLRAFPVSLAQARNAAGVAFSEVPDLAVPDPPSPDLAAPEPTPPDLAAPNPTARDLTVPLADHPPDLAHPDLAPVNPWPAVDLVRYGSGDGLDGPIIDANVDDGQNLWAASPDALYLLRPGAAHFQRYTAADGLHIQSFIDPAGNPNTTSITAIAGGRSSEVYVGYYGYESDDRYADTLAQRQLGQADRVVVGSDGNLQIVRYEFRCDAQHSVCWEDRSPRRMLYAHTGAAAGHLFIGFDHGVTHVYQDRFGDHIHVETWWHYPNGSITEKMGEWFGLAVLPTGELWTAGAYGAGLQTWNSDPPTWVTQHYRYAFTLLSSNHDLDQPSGYREDNRGVAVTPDGNVWFATLRNGLWSWNSSSNGYGSIRHWDAAGLPSDLNDIAADPDGTLWIVTWGGQLLRFDPASSTVRTWADGDGVLRVWVDPTVSPRAVYVSMSSGVAVIRAK
jgi:hypothetical protein